MRGLSIKRCGTIFAVVLCGGTPGLAGDGKQIETGYNSYGYPGMIDMPVAASRPDGELAFSISHFAGQTRNTMTFQILPRLSGSFRYSVLNNVVSGDPIDQKLYDRSFSVHYRFADETAFRPALAFGLNDFFGTGIYSSEYLVATKTFGKSLRVTAGLGWGRLGGVNGFTNPLGIIDDRFETRPEPDIGEGGTVQSAAFFRGDAAFFGGIEWQATGKLKLTLEYSSDNYPEEDPLAFERESQFNFGATYKIRPMTDISLRYLYGSEFGVQITSALNPRTRPNNGGLEPAPPPVLARGTPGATALSWSGSIDEQARVRQSVSEALDGQGIRLHGFSLGPDTVRVEIDQAVYNQKAQAIGRTARLLTRLLPPQIERFDITLVESGLPVTEVQINRGDLERFEHDIDAAGESFARARIFSPTGPSRPVPGLYPDFDWGVTPYLSPSFFDPDDPLRADFGAQLKLAYKPMPGLEFEGIVRQKVFGNLDESTRRSDSILPRVRSEFNIYDREGENLAITQLTAAKYFKPGRDLYGRVTLGYLERMFGGFSSELLWKRNDSPFALGAEVNYAVQRDFDQRFGFQNYDVLTGHLSGYLQMDNGFHVQVDAGRYLAGDWGGTLTIDREFGNGWRIGAFATLTDVSFDDFGEGSFDKGIRITFPVSWLIGEPNKTNFSTTIRPVLRDGGARLEVPGRLYERIRPRQNPVIENGWGRFWR